jgi:hypothetical protein
LIERLIAPLALKTTTTLARQETQILQFLDALQSISGRGKTLGIFARHHTQTTFYLVVWTKNIFNLSKS